MIEKILDKLQYQILRLLSAEELNTETFSDLVNVYQTFQPQYEKSLETKQRQYLFNHGSMLKARRRAEQSKVNAIDESLSLRAIMKKL